MPRPCIEFIARCVTHGDFGKEVNLHNFANKNIHGDNSKIAGAITLMDKEWKEIIKNGGGAGLECEDLVKKLCMFGLMMHTVHDLYTHSEWIEKNGGFYPVEKDRGQLRLAGWGVSEGYYGTSGFATPDSVPLWKFWNDLTPSISSQPSAVNVPPGMITGDYDTWPRDTFTATGHGTINKDGADSIRARFHNSAVRRDNKMDSIGFEKQVGYSNFELAFGASARHTAILWQAMATKLGITQEKLLVCCKWIVENSPPVNPVTPK